MDTRQKTEFCDRFIGQFLLHGFGTLGKQAIDRLTFSLLLELGYLGATRDPHTISRVLKVSPTKASNLLYEYNMLAPIERDREWLRTELAELLSRTHLGLERDGTVKLHVENRLLREEIEHFISTIGPSPDYSFNKNLLVIDLGTFCALVEKMALPDAYSSLSRELRKHKTALGSANNGRDLLMAFLRGAAEEAGRKVVDLSWLLIDGGASEIAGHIGRLLTK